MGSSIMAQLDLDESRFSAGLTNAEKRFEMFGQKVNSMSFDRGAKNFRQAFGGLPGSDSAAGSSSAPGGHSLGQSLNRDFGVGASVRTLLLFGATNSAVEKVVEKIAGLWKSAAESATKIATESERALAATLKIVDFGRTDKQRLTGLQRDEKSMRGQMREAGFGVTDEDREKVAKLDADLKENALAQLELKKKIGEAAQKTFADDMARGKKISDEQYKRYYEALTAEQKIAEQKRLSAEYDRRANFTTGAARAENELKAEEAITEQKRLQSEFDKQAVADAKKIADEELERERQEDREGAKAEAHRQRELRARLALGQAETNLADARAERTQITLGDAVSGRRGTPTERAQARRIADLEKRAQRVRDAGGDGADARAQQLFDRAGDLRKNMNGLTANDREPFRGLEDQMKKAVDNLDAIKNSLEPEGLD